MLQLSAALIQAGLYARARQTLDALLEIDRDCEAAYCQRILACAMLGDYDEAELSFYLARQITDHCPACLDHLGQAYEMRRDPQRAIACWIEAKQVDPDHPGLNAHLARAYRQVGQAERALTLFRHELREDPGNTRLLIDLAELLEEEGKYVEAGEKLRRVLEQDPMDVEALVRLGELCLHTDRPGPARTHFELAAKMEPAWPGLQLGLACACLAADDHAGAREHAYREIDHRGHSPRQAVELARVLIELRAYARVVALLEPMTAGYDPVLLDDPEAYIKALMAIGFARLFSGDPVDAARDFRRVLRITRDHAAAKRYLAMAYLEAGHLRRARAACRKACRDHPLDRRLARFSRRVHLAWLRSRLPL